MLYFQKQHGVPGDVLRLPPARHHLRPVQPAPLWILQRGDQNFIEKCEEFY